ncbi:retropepsin-like aspartic protease family protein [Haliea sp. E17]|uniref:retropepsin-like aspartic protease family protein n=1 Tax=Haliea sp. E17 TaxID=3401576 RepID=UPI003AAE6DC9
MRRQLARFGRLVSAMALSMLAAQALAAPRITVEGLMPGAAVIMIDGQRKMLKEGDSFGGVKLISARSQIATLEVDGQRQVLGLSSRVVSNYVEAETLSVDIPRNARLQYHTTAQINGRQIPVLVDTGANLVAMNKGHAKRLGINLKDAIPQKVETASGVADAWRVNLRAVNIGGIVVNNVEAAVLAGSFPTDILLGMTYLRHVKIEENQGIMTLSQQR